jgi:hypothetical protein
MPKHSERSMIGTDCLLGYFSTWLCSYPVTNYPLWRLTYLGNKHVVQTWELCKTCFSISSILTTYRDFWQMP